MCLKSRNTSIAQTDRAVGKAGEFNEREDQTVNINVTDKIKGIRLVNKEQTAGWVRIGELDIRAPKNMTTPITYKVIKTERWKVAQGKETSLMTEMTIHSYGTILMETEIQQVTLF